MKTKDIPFTELRVGRTYRNNGGGYDDTRTVTRQNVHNGRYRFFANGNWYAANGESEDGPSFNLIAEIVPDDEPEPHASRATDLINHPPHYTRGKMECIQIIEAMLTPEEFRGYLKGSAIKYTYRDGSKGGENTRQSDSAKAEWYASCRADFDRRRNV
jgi:hypothetical protein